MVCNNCGNAIPNGSHQCPYCGKPAGYMGGAAYQGQPARIDNIFSALVHERSAGAIWEFALWCTVCVCVILSMAAAIVVSSRMEEYTVYFRMTWLGLMFLEIGSDVLMAFRIKPVMMLVSAGAVQFFIPVIMFVSYAAMYHEIDDKVPAAMIVLFMLVLLAAIGLVSCACVHFFSRIELGKITAILDVVVAGLMLFFVIGIGASSSFQSSWAVSKSGFGLGVTSLIGCNAVLAVYYMLFFFGCIDSGKQKIAGGGVGSFSGGGYGSPGGGAAFTPGVQWIRGQYQGQVMYLKGHETIFGSQAGAASVVIVSPYISHRHCSVRYNVQTGMYEILDLSTNGVYAAGANGGTNRIPPGNYVPCPRGSIISLGSMEQQFRLL